MNNLNVATKYYLTSFLVIVVVPVTVIVLYEWLTGGVLNGVAGSWREATVSPDIFLLFINPLLLLSGYALLIHYFRKHIYTKNGTLSKTPALVVFVVATAVVLVGVFWKALTT